MAAGSGKLLRIHGYVVRHAPLWDFPSASLKCNRGIVNSYGAFQTIYEDTLPNSPSTIAWVGSVQGFILLLVGCLSGPIYDRGYFRALIVPGAFLTSFGMLMTSFATKYYQILLAQGICMGIGMGLIYIPCVAVLASYFRQRRALALGLAAAGSGSG